MATKEWTRCRCDWVRADVFGVNGCAANHVFDGTMSLVHKEMIPSPSLPSVRFRPHSHVPMFVPRVPTITSITGCILLFRRKDGEVKR